MKRTCLPNLPILVTVMKEEWFEAENEDGSLQVPEKVKYKVKKPQLLEEAQVRELPMRGHERNTAGSGRLQAPKKDASARRTCRVC